MIWESAGFLPRLSKDFSLSFSRFSFAFGLRYKLILIRLRPRPATLRFGEEAGMPARLSLKSELIVSHVSSFSYNVHLAECIPAPITSRCVPFTGHRAKATPKTREDH